MLVDKRQLVKDHECVMFNNVTRAQGAKKPL